MATPGVPSPIHFAPAGDELQWFCTPGYDVPVLKNCQDQDGSFWTKIAVVRTACIRIMQESMFSILEAVVDLTAERLRLLSLTPDQPAAGARALGLEIAVAGVGIGA
ncbi:hypothetical protein LTR09_008442 [Extremus antarcticus]|uniref:Uncharacterized protein n=1 Tax=Extremus antarcticus TaxID=702011 RepID=A0AAJ0DHJ3_9PEZI|nr:hypothetical protein LTR09_008442 [Extremus antarcticus]